MDKASLFAAADKASEKGQVKKALEYLESILRADPNDIKALNKATDLYVKINDIEKTVDYLSRIAMLYSKDGFYTRAIAIYKRILKINSSAPNLELIYIHEQLADLYAQLGLVSDSMSHFKIVIEFYDRAGNRPALLTVLEKVAELDPENIESQLKLTDFFAEEGREESLQNTFQRLVEACESTGNTSGLISIYEKWLEFNDNDESLLKSLVNLYVQTGEPKKALARLQKIFRKDPYKASTLELLSQVFLAMKQPEKARVVDIELFKLHRKNGSEDKALELEEKLKAPDPFHTERPKPILGEVDPAPESFSLEESLIAGSATDPEEKKIISECDVYAKYGLLDKAREVLTGSLDQFSKSLGIRWKLVQICKELDLQAERRQQLQEIKKIAEEQNEENWLALVSAELDEGHQKSEPQEMPLESRDPELDEAVLGPAVDQELEPAAMANETTLGAPIEEMPSSLIFDDFSESEVSIVVEDFSDHEVAEEISMVSDLEASAEVEPAMMTEDFEPEEGDQKLAKNEVDVIEELTGSALLSESDFSDEELEAFEDRFDPKAEHNEVAEDVASPLQIEINEDSDFEIRQLVDEIRFFRSEGLTQEADELEKNFRQKFPQWQGSLSEPLESRPPAPIAAAKPLTQKSVDVDVLGSKMKMKVQEDERDDAEDDFFDLVSELHEEFDEAKTSAEVKKSPGEISDVFKAFKKGIEETVAKDDFQTHFDLGTAYREMGLLDDALEEFLLCAKLPGKRVVSLYQAGLCEVARKSYQQAVHYFDEALREPELDDQEKISLSYELAELFLRQEQKSKAAALFQEIQKIDPEFREVQKRLEQCR